MDNLIKIFGERNTNTNYLSKLIQLNLNVREIPGIVPHVIMWMQKKLPGKELVRDIYFYLTQKKNLGWKHTKVQSANRLRSYPLVKNNNVVFVTITKNPYSWLLSLYRSPYHQHYTTKPDFETFLKTPWKTVHRDNVGGALKNPVELWNVKNSSYLKLAELDVLNITSESTFADPSAVIDEIHKRFSVSKVSKEFINYERSTKDSSKDFKYYRDYYLSEKWRDELSDNAILIINETVDMELMDRFGYDVLTTRSSQFA
ncbi:MAG: hypothetical protein KQH63_18985 [Desulfobulbaceae bacterium]|nr:hypothetical protein [Desulfobulbaceae bacterium]